MMKNSIETINNVSALYQGQNYQCNCCGRRGRRLLRPIESQVEAKLICIPCAVKHQAVIKQYSLDDAGKYTIPHELPKVSIENGNLVFPEGYPHLRPDDMWVMMPSLKFTGRLEEARMIPAIPVDPEGWLMLTTSTMNSEKVQEWYKLPIL